MQTSPFAEEFEETILDVIGVEGLKYIADFGNFTSITMRGIAYIIVYNDCPNLSDIINKLYDGYPKALMTTETRP